MSSFRIVAMNKAREIWRSLFSKSGLTTIGGSSVGVGLVLAISTRPLVSPPPDLMIHLVSDILIGGLLAYVAYQNYRINRHSSRLERDKLRLELFDRRYRVFSALRELFKVFFVKGTFDNDDIPKFALDIADAEFLFDDEMKSYLEGVRTNAIHLMLASQRLSRGVEPEDERQRLVDKMYRLEMWFAEEHKQFASRFRKFLRFSIRKGV